MTKEFYRWWIWFVSSLVLTGAAMYMGVYDAVATHMATYIFTIITLAVYVGSSLSVGYKTYHGQENMEKLWFMSEFIMALGMTGTIVGLIMIFSSFTDNFDLQNIEKMKQLNMTVSSGVMIALFTTLGGLVYSQLLKSQLVLVERQDQSNETKES